MDLQEERGVIDEKKLDISAINHYLYYPRKHLPHIYLGVSSIAYHLLTQNMNIISKDSWPG